MRAGRRLVAVGSWLSIGAFVSLVAGCSVGPQVSPLPGVDLTPTAGQSVLSTSTVTPAGSAGTATPQRTTTPSIYSGPTLPPTSQPSAPPGQWQVERISGRAFDRVAVTVDETGSLHVAATGPRGLVYLTNAGGGWTSRALGKPAGTERYDRFGSVAIEESGLIAVAIERRDCPVLGCMATGGEVYVATIGPNGWSEMTRLGEGLQPSIQLHEGEIHLVYVGGESSDEACNEIRPVRYATNESGSWLDMTISRDGHWGLIGAERDGDPVVVAGNPCETLGPEGAFLARPTSEDPVLLDAVPGVSSYDELVDVTVDSLDRVHLLYRQWDDTNHYIRRDAQAWTEPIELDGVAARSIATDDDGVAHVAGFGEAGLWLASNGTGSFLADQISTIAGSWNPVASVAVDHSGRPHVLFVVPDADGEPMELWHATLIPD